MVGRCRKDHFFCSLILFLLEKTKPQYQFLAFEFLLLGMQCFPSIRASGELRYIFCCWHYFSPMLKSSITPFPWIFLVSKWRGYWHTLQNYIKCYQWSMIWRRKMLGLLKGQRLTWCPLHLLLLECFSVGWQLTVWWEVHRIYGGRCASHTGVWRNLPVSC